jgi:hypothetical protein
MRESMPVFKGKLNMTLEAFAAPTLDVVDSIFDFSRSSAPAPANQDAPLAADRADPEPGWATRNPEAAMLFLFLTPRDGIVAEELLAAA